MLIFKLMSIMIEGTQTNIQAAILGYTSIEPYQHYYFIDANLVSSDLDDSFANKTLISPCDSNPCQNDGTCVIGFAGSFVCLCPDYIIGIEKH